MKPRKLPETYVDNVGDKRSDPRAVGTARKIAEIGSLIVNGRNDVVDGTGGARIVLAITEFGSDSIQLGAEVAENVLDVPNVSLGDDLGDGAGQDHRTGGEDSEDGGETHGEEGGKEGGKATWAGNDWSCWREACTKFGPAFIDSPTTRPCGRPSGYTASNQWDESERG